MNVLMRNGMTTLVTLLGGALFGFGLAYSQMISPEVVLSFLTGKDEGLMLVMGGAVGITLLSYQLIPKRLTKPILGPGFEQRHTPMNRNTYIGAALFGLGWGLSGVCPGPAIAGLGAGNWSLLWSLLGLALGAYLQGVFAQLSRPKASV